MMARAFISFLQGKIVIDPQLLEKPRAIQVPVSVYFLGCLDLLFQLFGMGLAKQSVEAGQG
jgi:hypothetical protein